MSIATLAGWAKQLLSGPDSHNEFEERHRAELLATEIRAALDRLAAELHVLGHEVDEAMVEIDVLGNITDELDSARTKINPLARWSQAEIDNHARHHDLPAHPLAGRG